jgi:TonB family protein
MHSPRPFYCSLICFLFIVSSWKANAQAVPVGQAVVKSISLSRLREKDTRPFHLKAVTSPANSFIPDYTATIEEYWVAPDRWRRTIRSKSFEQTVVVNGSKRLEHNSSDYYPKWLNDIAVALTDVAPDPVVSDIRALTDTVPLGESSSVRYQPSSTDGKVTNAWWGSVQFAPPGVLTWISGKGFSAAFKDYVKFHGKYLAQTVETFPMIPHGDVKTHVEVSDYDAPDDSLFDVDKPTPPEDQICLVSMKESDYRKDAVDVPEMKWAPVQSQPTTGVLSLYIVTDKTGKVREARLITSNNMAMGDNAEELIRKWTFKPHFVDGVPAEVQTTMTFAFNTTIEGDQAKYQAASYYFKRGRDLTYPRTDGSPPFHLIGTFSWRDASGLQDGRYEEFWTAPNKWRREITIHEIKTVETRLDDDHYVQPAQGDVARLAVRAVSLFTAEFPGYAYSSPETDWHMTEIMCGNQPCLRVSMGPTHNLPEGHYPRAYYFDAGGIVLARSQSSDLISYGDFQPWAGKQVPREITLRIGSDVGLTAHVDTLDALPEKNDEFFMIPKVKPSDWVRPAPW